jgi:arginyl-tRNA synthetase
VITETLAEIVNTALESAVADGVIDAAPTPSFERPKRREHGDWATNVALVAGKGKGAPRDVAAALVDRLPPNDVIEKVEVAGPGFLNFHLSPTWLYDVVRRASDPGQRFGWAKERSKEKVNVEFVSANPTGPINVVSGRHAAVGGALASILEAAGYEVTREFYLNDAGRQLLLFGESIAAHYLRSFGLDASVPEDGYQGEYVKELAEKIATEIGDRLVSVPAEQRNEELTATGLAAMRTEMERSLERFRTTYDVWFSERTLHETGKIAEGVERLRQKGLVEDRDGAVWFLSERLGDDKDRVLIRGNGVPTYLAGDVAYLTAKFDRGFDRLIYLWGADHHGTVARLKAATEALGYDRDAVEVKLVQIVTLKRGGETVKASKRGGVLVELDELVDEVGVDAARYTFLTRSIDAPIEFDIEAVKQQAPDNPVYYVQYAHARICSILRKAQEEGRHVDVSSADLNLLVHPSEDELMRKLATYEEVIPETAELRAPQRMTRFVEELASTFSAFYRDCKVVTDNDALTGARLSLCVATKSVIASALGLLGVSAPESM